MIIDIHIHVAGKGDTSECYMSETLQKSPPYLLMLIATGQLFEEVNDATIRQHLVETLNGSSLVDRGVFLAMEQPYDADGNPMQGHLYTPNDYVADLADRNEKVLFGASVHPDRADALSELERVAARGAVLLKWIPSVQNINPRRERYLPFYEKLKDLGLPLLCHVGAEHAIPSPARESDGYYQRFNEPRRLIAALEAGLTVIAAHCCLPCFSWDPDHTDDFFDLMHEADEKEWHLYADVSALACPFPHRVGLLGKVLRELPHDRLVFGSDYPVPVSSLWPGAAGEIDPVEWAEATLTANPLDRNLKMIRALGFGEQVLTKAETILRLT